MAESEIVDLRTDAFARRLGNLLVATRSAGGRSLRSMARSSGGDFSASALRALEAATAPTDEDVVARVAALYGCDLGQILPLRLPVSIRAGILSAGGVAAIFDPYNPASLLEAYLKLVRSLRRQQRAPAVDLRRDDIEVLAGFLGQSGDSVVDRLAVLMGAARPQRMAMAALFASGAVVIGLVGSAVAGSPVAPHRAASQATVIARVAMVTSTSTQPTPDASTVSTVSTAATHRPAHVDRSADGAQPSVSSAPPAAVVPSEPAVTPIAAPIVAEAPARVTVPSTATPTPAPAPAPAPTTEPTPNPPMIDTDLIIADVDMDTPPLPPMAPSPPAP